MHPTVFLKNSNLPYWAGEGVQCAQGDRVQVVLLNVKPTCVLWESRVRNTVWGRYVRPWGLWSSVWVLIFRKKQNAVQYNTKYTAHETPNVTRFGTDSFAGPTKLSHSTTNKMQRFTISLILQDALHVSDGFSVHHQELKTAHTASDQYCYLLLAWPG